jgi:hypothetical protein
MVGKMKNIVALFFLFFTVALHAQEDSVKVEKRIDDGKGSTYYCVDFSISKVLVPKIDSIGFELIKDDKKLFLNTVVFTIVGTEIYYLDGWKRPLLPSGSFSKGATCFSIKSGEKSSYVLMTIYYKDGTKKSKKYFE